jgi:feruloyl esterase
MKLIYLLLILITSNCTTKNSNFTRNLTAWFLFQNEKSLEINYFQIKDFGYNPGGLNMYVYKPNELLNSPPVVFSLHGCSESANSYRNSGWDLLAEERKFLVVYPEQPLVSASNNRCFGWFNSTDTTKDMGQAKSILSMLEYVIKNYNVNPNKVYINGLSAGGYFASNMVALYPEKFQAFGSVAAGPSRCYPEGVNSNPFNITQCTNGLTTVNKTGQEWKDILVNLNPQNQVWPRAIFIHGDSDIVVKPTLLEEARKQWTTIHLVSSPFQNIDNANFIQKTYGTVENPLVETWILKNLGHAFPINNCGKQDTFYVQAAICGSKVMADFFKL